MTLTESIVEDAALEWFLLRQGYGGQVGELGYAVGHGPHLAPGEPAAERDSFGDVVLVGRLRAAIRRLNPAIPEEASACALHADRRATGKRYFPVRFERRPNP
jgi:type I restriction enzyme R subunit